MRMRLVAMEGVGMGASAEVAAAAGVFLVGTLSSPDVCRYNTRHNTN